MCPPTQTLSEPHTLGKLVDKSWGVRVPHILPVHAAETWELRLRQAVQIVFGYSFPAETRKRCYCNSVTANPTSISQKPIRKHLLNQSIPKVKINAVSSEEIRVIGRPKPEVQFLKPGSITWNSKCKTSHSWQCMLSHVSHAWLLVTLLSVTRQAPLSIGFSRQEYWSGLPYSPPGDLPHPGTEPTSLMSPALAGGFFTTEPLRSPSDTEPLSRVWLSHCPKHLLCLLRLLEVELLCINRL